MDKGSTGIYRVRQENESGVLKDYIERREEEGDESKKDTEKSMAFGVIQV